MTLRNREHFAHGLQERRTARLLSKVKFVFLGDLLSTHNKSHNVRPIVFGKSRLIGSAPTTQGESNLKRKVPERNKVLNQPSEKHLVGQGIGGCRMHRSFCRALSLDGLSFGNEFDQQVTLFKPIDHAPLIETVKAKRILADGDGLSGQEGSDLFFELCKQRVHQPCDM